METRERRIANLRSIGKTIDVAYKILAGLIIVLPVITLGTEYHDSVYAFCVYFSVGIFTGPAYARWGKLVHDWLRKNGRSIDDLRYLAAMFAGILPVGTFVYYWVFRLFKHTGDWSTTLAFSWDTLVLSLLLNSLMASTTGLMQTAVVHYRGGESIIIKDGQPPKLWHVIAFFSLTLVAPVLVIGVASQFFKADTACIEYLLTRCQ